MTTITIDTPLELKKTRFATPLEAAYFLMKYKIDEEDKERAGETPKNILAYEASVNGQNEQFSLSQAKTIVL
ncbi:MAG: hypothetical protein QM564_06745 [Bergeyella sp.]